MTERFLEFLVRVGRAIRDALRSRYVRELETEVGRLRAENRALLNSLLGTAGIPPIFDLERQASAEAGRAAPVVRRRSWQQLGRMLEIEEARRLRQLQQQTAEAEPRSSAPDIFGAHEDLHGEERGRAQRRKAVARQTQRRRLSTICAQGE